MFCSDTLTDTKHKIGIDWNLVFTCEQNMITCVSFQYKIAPYLVGQPEIYCCFEREHRI